MNCAVAVEEGAEREGREARDQAQGAWREGLSAESQVRRAWGPPLTSMRLALTALRLPPCVYRLALCALLLALGSWPVGAAQFAEWADSPTNGAPVLKLSPGTLPSPGTNAQISTAGSPSSPVLVTSAGYVPDDKYKLRSGDRVAFQILEDREPTPKSIIVMDSGEIDVPYIGRVMASEKTCKTLSSEVKTLLEREYYHRATVVISLDAANKLLGRVYVWGQVRNQGAIDIAVNENLTAGKAILRAGGFGDFANRKRVKLVRSSPDGTKQTFELNMTSILEQGKTELDALLQPDDFIIVPSRLFNL
jgi:protein involved in polysaccharide export with SLBB domain